MIILPEKKYQNCFAAIIDRIHLQQKGLTNRELLEICGNFADFRTGQANPHFCHEIAETAFNLLIREKFNQRNAGKLNAVEFFLKQIKPLASRLPTQSWRSPEQITYQQFSTPPAIGFLVAHTLNIKEGETVLEPSAGTGSLAVWSAAFGASVITNEIEPRRRELLQQLSFTPTAFNAEFINDFLEPVSNIDTIMMNPPFSANGGRTRNSSRFGFRHVASALERLKNGGKFAIILGEAGGLDTKTGRDFWHKTVEYYQLKADLKLSGREYYKNGTNVDINIIFGEKLRQPPQIDRIQALSEIPFFYAQTIEHAFEQITVRQLRFN